MFALTPEKQLLISSLSLDYFRSLHQQFLRFVLGQA